MDVKSNSLQRLLISNGVGIVVSLITQILAIPFYLSYWGHAISGAWMALGAISMLLNTTDFGFYNVIGTQMLKARADGDLSIYESLKGDLIRITKGLSWLAFSLNLLLGFGVLFSMDGLPLSTVDMIGGVVCISLNTAMFFWFSLKKIIFWMDGRLAYANLFLNLQRFLGFGVSIAVLAWTKSFWAVALALAGTSLLAFKLLGLKTQVVYGGGISFSCIRRYVKKCFSASTFTLSSAIVVQGATLMLAWNATPSDIVTYSSYRVIGRAPLLLATVLAQSVWPRCAELYVLKGLGASRALLMKTLYYYVGLSFAGVFLWFVILPYVWPKYVRGSIELNWTYAIMSNIDSIAFGVVNLIFFYKIAIKDHARIGGGLLVLAIIFFAVAFFFVDSAASGIVCALGFSLLALILVMNSLRSKILA